MKKAIGYYHIQKANKTFVKTQAKKKGFKTVSDYVDYLISKAKASTTTKTKSAQ